MDTGSENTATDKERANPYAIQSKKALQKFVKQVRSDLDLSIKSDHSGLPRKHRKKHVHEKSETTAMDGAADASDVTVGKKRKRVQGDEGKRSAPKASYDSGVAFVDDAELAGSTEHVPPVVTQQKKHKKHKSKSKSGEGGEIDGVVSGGVNNTEPQETQKDPAPADGRHGRTKDKKHRKRIRIIQVEDESEPAAQDGSSSMERHSIPATMTTTVSAVRERKKKLQQSFDQVHDALCDMEEEKAAAERRTLSPDMVHKQGPGPYFDREKFFTDFDERLNCCFLYGLYAIKSSHAQWNENNKSIYERYLEGRLSGSASARMAKQLKELLQVERMERYRVLLIMNILASMSKLKEENDEFERTRQAGRDHHQKFTLKHGKFLELFRMIRTEGRMEARPVVIQKNCIESAGQNTKECDGCYEVIRKGNLESIDIGVRKSVAHVCSTCREHIFLFSELVHLKSTIFRTYEREIWPNIRVGRVNSSGQSFMMPMSDITSELQSPKYRKAIANMISTSVLRRVLTESPDCFFRVEITMEEDTIRQGADHLNPIFHSSDRRSNPSAVQYPPWAEAMDIAALSD